GELLRSEGAYADDNPFRFSTKFQDNETGLINYGFRYYDPRNGRFINKDPIEEAGGLNLYGFAGNDGVNGFDVHGLSLKKLFKSIGKFLKKFWKPIVAVVAGIVTGGLAFAATPATWGAVASGAVAGAAGGFTSGVVGAALNGASFSQAIQAGLIGGATGA